MYVCIYMYLCISITSIIIHQLSMVLHCILNYFIKKMIFQQEMYVVAKVTDILVILFGNTILI